MTIPTNLHGKTILIGRDPLGQGRLRVAVGSKAADIAVQPQVPTGVSRVKDGGEAHCSLSIDSQGGMRVTNLKTANYTWVNGVQVMSKALGAEDSLALGPSVYALDLGKILSTASTLIGVSYSIAHLGDVYDEYEKALEDIQRRQQTKQRRRMLPIMFGSLNGVLAAVLPALGVKGGYIVTIPLALAGFALYFVALREKDTSIEDRKAATDRFTAAYVCPKCGRFMGNVSYRLLRQNNPGPEMTCPGPSCKAHLRFEE